MSIFIWFRHSAAGTRVSLSRLFWPVVTNVHRHTHTNSTYARTITLAKQILFGCEFVTPFAIAIGNLQNIAQTNRNSIERFHFSGGPFLCAANSMEVQHAGRILASSKYQMATAFYCDSITVHLVILYFTSILCCWKRFRLCQQSNTHTHRQHTTRIHRNQSEAEISANSKWDTVSSAHLLNLGR